MSVKIMTLVFGSELGGPTKKAVALKMADVAWDDGTNVFPSVRLLARHAEISERAVQYSIQALKRMGILEISRQGGKGQKSTTLYRFNMPELQRLYSETQAKWHEEDITKGANYAPLRVHVVRSKGARGAPDPLSKPLDIRSAKYVVDDKTTTPATVHRFVSEAALDRVRSVAPGWDRQMLLQRFTDWPGSKNARNMDAAFLGWAKKYTGGKPPGTNAAHSQFTKWAARD